MAINTKTHPIAIFFQAEEQPHSRIFYCPFCRGRLFDTSGRLVSMADNGGPIDGLYFEIKCRTSDCQQIWRVFGPPAVEFIPIVTINGVRIN